MNNKQRLLAKLDPRLRVALKNLYDEWRILRNHRRGVRDLPRHIRAGEPLRVQFGCGPCRKEGWLNTDVWPGPWANPDVCLDATRPFPFADGSVAEIYCEHMFEHLDYPAGVSHFLAECFRVLGSGGLLHIGVPDVDAQLAHYQSCAAKNARVPDPGGHYLLDHPLEELNYAFHQGGEHKFLYNEQFLAALLAHFGFSAARRRPFDPKLDSEHRRDGTLYMVATKP